MIHFLLRSGTSNHLFSLDATSGVITLTGKLDYENKTKHILTALAFNPDRPTMFSTGTATITVDVTVGLGNSHCKPAPSLRPRLSGYLQCSLLLLSVLRFLWCVFWPCFACHLFHLVKRANLSYISVKACLHE